MKFTFTKMHGLGNDFVVINNIAQQVTLSTAQRHQLADRHFGVGCDQILLIEKSQHQEIDFRYRIFNADGHEVEQCGNGVRCFARYVYDHGLTHKTEIAVETSSGIIYPRLAAGEQVAVNMGTPRFTPAEIPFIADHDADHYTLEVNSAPLQIGVVSMGNPHAVLRVEDVATAPVATLGPLIERHHRFPAGVNVGFLQVVDRHTLRLRVYERGVGETLACGTGACAAMAVARLRGWVDAEVQVHLPGGALTIQWPGADQALWMTGPATYVFEGSIEL